jgi:hypothetical protein
MYLTLLKAETAPVANVVGASVDSRFRGNDGIYSTVIPAQAGIQR